METWWSPTLSRMLGLLCFLCKMIKLLFSGCSTNDNCPESHPICGHGGGDHLCGCNANEDCKDGEICDTEDLDWNGDDKECIPWAPAMMPFVTSLNMKTASTVTI